MKKELTEEWRRRGIITDHRLIRAFEEVDRQDFIQEEDREEAYGDHPLSIGHGQTISQPTTIMIMLQALELKETDKVLEVGAGSGYNSALIAKIAGKVYTTEIIPELAEFARENLKKSNIDNVEVVCTDGSMGYEKEAPYDKIILTAACPVIPGQIVEQLREGGIIIAPVGGPYSQNMIKGRKEKDRLVTSSLGDFVFVPLKGREGYR